MPCMIDLFDLNNLENKIITADAMHCQKNTAKKICDIECDYVLCVKRNQPNLYADISLYVDDLRNSKAKSDKEKYVTACTTEKNKSRYEKRTCYLVNDISWLEGHSEWTELKSIFAVERIVTENNVTSTETSYYISSLEAAPERFLEIVREHRKIESMHYTLDVVMSEDECQLYSANAQKTMNIFRKLAIAMHKNYISHTKSKISMRRNMNRCSMDDNLLIEVIKTFL
ncbi:MAG: ISAs1 family transposase [Clostridiales bacterium]|nr:ISAs1 family transposase [Clostridiales bacterium]